ncbi:MAG: GGDEF domain-containing protein [Spirochaetae bacterium HGW-Spirochaetae-8]|nr:MAG: GGDEF domain-containing protein [Spirochaetae bacterium HGW-Spirochaetae-8]
MVRITKKVFDDLAIWMVGFGIFIGIVFPYFMLIVGVSSTIALSWWFCTACILAGLFVGGVNIILARRVVGNRLRLLAEHMVGIEGSLKAISGKNEAFDCSSMKCHIPVDSADAIGESAQAFNKLVDTLSRSMHTEISIRTYTQMLTNHLETDKLCGHALDSLLEISGAQGGAILVEDSGEMRLLSSFGIRKPELLLDNQLLLNVLKTGSRNLVDIPEGLLLDGVVTDFRPRVSILEPIKYKQISMGIIILVSGSLFREDVLDTLDLFSRSLALALHNAMVHDQVQKLAAIDPLTGIYNRRFGMTRLHEEFVRAVQIESAIGLIMLDIDHFKGVNDTYGHSIGDRIIRQVSNIAREAMREGDILVRLGGDEFLAVLLGASLNDVSMTAERIRRQIDERVITIGDQHVHVTVSIGGVSFPEKEVAGEHDLIDAADRALYHAKNSGRNKVSF